MRWLATACVLLLLTGCAVRVSTSPFEWQSVFLYSRITDCPAADVPEPLPPQMKAEQPEKHCLTLEVGAKSYADSISAIGTAIIGILAKVVLF